MSKVDVIDKSTLADYIKTRMAESKTYQCNTKYTIDECLTIILDYIINPHASVRSLAKKYKLGKTTIWTIIRYYPPKYDNKLAKMVYAKLMYRSKQLEPPVISPNDMTKLKNAYSELHKDGEYFKKFSKMKTAFLLWS